MCEQICLAFFSLSQKGLSNNTHTQGYIFLNKYIFGYASTGLPKVNLWVTKCVTKIP